MRLQKGKFGRNSVICNKGQSMQSIKCNKRWNMLKIVTKGIQTPAASKVGLDRF